jgi:hypothetical protein
MRGILLLGALALGGCAGAAVLGTGVVSTVPGLLHAYEPPRPWEALPPKPWIPPEPPSRLVPARPDFTFIDYSTGRQYWLWLYEDEQVRDNKVFVQDSGDFMRPATLEESAFAWAHFERVWRSRSFQERIEYVSRPPQERWGISPLLVDAWIAQKRRSVEELAARALERQAQLWGMAAAGQTGAPRGLLALELDETYGELARAQAELAQIEQLKRAVFALP